MTKQEIRAQISIKILTGMRELLRQDKKIDVITVHVVLVEGPDWSKTGKLQIKLYKK